MPPPPPSPYNSWYSHSGGRGGGGVYLFPDIYTPDCLCLVQDLYFDPITLSPLLSEKIHFLSRRVIFRLLACSFSTRVILFLPYYSLYCIFYLFTFHFLLPSYTFPPFLIFSPKDNSWYFSLHRGGVGGGGYFPTFRPPGCLCLGTCRTPWKGGGWGPWAAPGPGLVAFRQPRLLTRITVGSMSANRSFAL